MTPFLRVRAVNTATDSDNKIHDNRVAAAYGFHGGLVPGVTIYGYMTAAITNLLGPEWLHRGAMDLRFYEPFYDGEEVVVSVENPGEVPIKVTAGTRASGSAWMLQANAPADFPAEHSASKQPASRETIQPGMLLGTLEKTLDLSQPGVSAPFDAFLGPERYAHPAIILGLANELLMHNYHLGPWIHSSSEVRNSKPARDGEQIQVRGKIEDAYERKGHEFIVVDVVVVSAADLLTRIRHTAIWKPRKV